MAALLIWALLPLAQATQIQCQLWDKTEIQALAGLKDPLLAGTLKAEARPEARERLIKSLLGDQVSWAQTQDEKMPRLLRKWQRLPQEDRLRLIQSFFNMWLVSLQELEVREIKGTHWAGTFPLYRMARQEDLVAVTPDQAEELLRIKRLGIELLEKQMAQHQWAHSWLEDFPQLIKEPFQYLSLLNLKESLLKRLEWQMPKGVWNYLKENSTVCLISYAGFSFGNLLMSHLRDLSTAEAMEKFVTLAPVGLGVALLPYFASRSVYGIMNRRLRKVSGKIEAYYPHLNSSEREHM